MWTGRSPASSRAKSSAIRRRVVLFGVVGGAADVRRQHDVGQGDQRIVGGEHLAGEVIEPGGGDLAGHERVGERGAVVQTPRAPR